MKLKKAVAISFAIVLAMAIAWILFSALRFLRVDNSNIIPAVPSTPIMGGDRDAHGCIGSAGYSWCEQKQKCLRVWEEKCVSCPDYAPVNCEGGKITPPVMDANGCYGPPICQKLRGAGGGQICTQDAKQCPDGSYVSRIEPGCQFAPCPGNASSR